MFCLQQESVQSSARRGTLYTPHGALETPFFMPIATKGAVKTLSSLDVERLGSPILLANTYHLWLRPGLEGLRAVGGLHRFMDWHGALLTDSGGFQVFSLEGLRKLVPEGVRFQSHLDGRSLLLTPELCMEIQRAIGSDLCMVLDVCTKLPTDQETVRSAVERTTDWARRSKEAFALHKTGSVNPDALLFAIVQGGTDLELRTQSAQSLTEIGFDGYALGGLSVGEPFAEACQVLDVTVPLLPKDRPHYFMGGAQPEEIIGYVQRGIDLFDCVLPTRNARHGQLYRFLHDDLTRPDFYETIQITNARYALAEEVLLQPLPSGDDEPVDAELARYTLGYLRHLFQNGEMLGARLATLWNLRFYLSLFKQIRRSIEEGRL